MFGYFFTRVNRNWLVAADGLCSRSTCVYPPSVDSITRVWLVRPPDQSRLDDSARNGRTQYISIKRWASRTDEYVAESAQRMTAVCRSAGIYMCQSGKKQRLTDRDSSPRSGFYIFLAMSLRLVLLRCSSHLLPCVHHGRPLRRTVSASDSRRDPG